MQNILHYYTTFAVEGMMIPEITAEWCKQKEAKLDLLYGVENKISEEEYKSLYITYIAFRKMLRLIFKKSRHQWHSVKIYPFIMN